MHLDPTISYVPSFTHTRIDFEETFQQRRASEGWKITLIWPALRSTLLWGAVFLFFESIAIYRGRIPSPEFAFFAVFPLIIGFLSASSYASWGRILRIGNGQIRLFEGRRAMTVCRELSELPAPTITAEQNSSTIRIGLRIPRRWGERKITFTTECSDEQIPKLLENLYPKCFDA